MVQVPELSARAFRESVNASGVTTIVLFHDPQVARSLSMKVIVDELANEYPAARFACVNIHQNADTPSRHSLLTFPTILVFEDGQLAGTFCGVFKRIALSNLLRAWLEVE